MNKTVEEYLLLPYTIAVRRYLEGDYPVWLAEVVELPGCVTDADTLEELEPMVKEAMTLWIAKVAWIESALEAGLPVPAPSAMTETSGKFLVRAPKSLHRQVAEAAACDGVSLNAWVNVVLARAVGAPQRVTPEAVAMPSKRPRARAGKSAKAIKAVGVAAD